MSDIALSNRPKILSSPVPAEFGGCWKLISGGSSVPYLEIVEEGSYSVSGGVRPMSVSADGSIFVWDGNTYNRVLGSGQTVFGVWKAPIGTDEFYFRTDYSSVYSDGITDIPGTINTLGDNASGYLIYWEKRAVISNMVDDGNGVFTTTAHSAFGGTDVFIMKIDQGNLVITSSLGNEFTYQSVDCSTLA